MRSAGSLLHGIVVVLLVSITASIGTGCSSTTGESKADGAAVETAKAEATPTTAAKKSEPAVADTAGSGAKAPEPSAPAKVAPAPVGSPEYWAEQIQKLEKNLKPLHSIPTPARPAKSRADLVSANLNRE